MRSALELLRSRLPESWSIDVEVQRERGPHDGVDAEVRLRAPDREEVVVLVEAAEAEMLRAFAAGVSEDARRRLPAGDPVMPFANLRDADWRRKKHGLTGTTARPVIGGHT